MKKVAFLLLVPTNGKFLVDDVNVVSFRAGNANCLAVELASFNLISLII